MTPGQVGLYSILTLIISELSGCVGPLKKA